MLAEMSDRGQIRAESVKREQVQPDHHEITLWLTPSKWGMTLSTLVVFATLNHPVATEYLTLFLKQARETDILNNCCIMKNIYPINIVDCSLLWE